MRVASLCSGYGGIELALETLANVELAFTADIGSGARKVLAHRFPTAPNLGDLASIGWGTVDWQVDVVTAGFPCQDVSQAGGRAGLRANSRSGVWYQVARGIDALQPKLVIVENVRGLLSADADSDMEPCPWCLGESGHERPLRACGAVLGDLADLGFDADWRLVSAADCGAPHRRERVFILAWSAENADRAAGDQWRISASGQAQGGRPRADAGRPAGEGDAAADTASIGFQGFREDAGQGTDRAGRQMGSQAGGHGPAGSGAAAANAKHDGQPASPAAGSGKGQEPGERGQRRLSQELAGDGGQRTDWGQRETAIHRWETITGRPAPRPVEPTGRDGGMQLSVRFVEWMMGLPDAWVTAVPGMSRTEMLTVLGNGVVPQQCALALEMLLPAYREVCASSRLVV